MRCQGGYSNVGFSSNCLSEVRLCLTGRFFIGGYPVTYEEEYTTAMARFEAMRGPEMAKVLSEEGSFYLLATAGSLIVIPSGYFLFQFAVSDTTFLKWGLWPRFKGEHCRVLRCLSSVASANPDSVLQPWVQYLMADPRSESLDH